MTSAAAKQDLHSVVAALGKPDYEASGLAFYNADCLKGLRAIAQPSIDLTVTSPPYNIGKEYEESLALDDYLDWCRKWLQELYRITKPNGALWLNLGFVRIAGHGRAVPLPYLMWQMSPFFLMQEIVWNYGAGVGCKSLFSPRNEKLLWYVRDEANYTFNLDAVRDPDVKYPLQKKNGKLRCNPLGKNPSDVWLIPKVTSGTDRSSKERTPHPAQFPEALIERAILASSNEGDLILDPFLGSGTTAVVARRLGRDVIGFEIRADYFDVARNRIMREIEEDIIAESQSLLFGTG